ncbi:MAG: DUF1232 domain-containing protein [Bacteroidales bacterium]|jgi:uncharacterized membrane protein YkvA (DUF1232 family)|nr:DUF1232 domain-containing protein [Bacteroidales bacterium]
MDKKIKSKSFSEPKLWKKINKVFQRVGMKVVYPVMLLYYLFKSNDVPLRAKSLIAGALTYFILPFDGLPDFIPFLGYADDLSLLAATVSNMIKYVSPEILELTRNKIDQLFKNKEESSKMEAEIQKRLKTTSGEKARK